MESSSNKVELNLLKLQHLCEERLNKLQKCYLVISEKEQILHELNSIPSKQVELSRKIVESANIQLELGT